MRAVLVLPQGNVDGRDQMNLSWARSWARKVPVRARQYLAVLAVSAGAVAATAASHRALEGVPAAPFLYAAVALSAWFAGVVPTTGVIITALAVLHLWLTPWQEIRPEALVVHTVTFVSVAATIALLHANLRRRIEEARGEVQDIVQDKNRFLLSVSHELRTPLTTILGSAELLEEGCPVALPTELEEHVTRIQAASLDLRQLVDKLLAFQDTQLGTMRCVYTEEDTTLVLTHVLRRVYPMARKRNVRITLDATDAPPHLVTDRDKLELILVELLTNAIFHGGTNVVLGVQADGDDVMFSVTDVGPGLTREQQLRVFEPFYQQRDALTREIGGLGLGLATARAYAELMGGSLAVTSRPRIGSTFHLTVPRRAA